MTADRALVSIEKFCVRPEAGSPVALKIEFTLDYELLTVSMRVLDMADSMRRSFAYQARSGQWSGSVMSAQAPGIDLETHAVFLRGSIRAQDDDVVTARFLRLNQLKTWMRRTKTMLRCACEHAVAIGHRIQSPAALAAVHAPAPLPFEVTADIAGKIARLMQGASTRVNKLLVCPPIREAFPVNFSNGLRYAAAPLNCQHCNQQVPDVLSRGYVWWPKPDYAQIQAASYCVACDAVTLAKLPLYADGSCFVAEQGRLRNDQFPRSGLNLRSSAPRAVIMEAPASTPPTRPLNVGAEGRPTLGLRTNRPMSNNDATRNQHDVSHNEGELNRCLLTQCAPLRDAFPVTFASGLVFYHAALQCQACKQAVADGFTRGEVIKPTPQLAVVRAALYCAACRIVTPYVSALYDDGRTITPKSGVWTREEYLKIKSALPSHAQATPVVPSVATSPICAMMSP